MDLSRRRAQAVRDYLIARGVTADQVAALGYGELRPVASNDTSEGRANNRRVEIVLPEFGGSNQQGTGGSVILTSSVAGVQAYANLGHYVAAKHGVTGLMRALAVEGAPHGIRCNSIHPTTVDTPMINNEFTRQWLERITKENDAPVDFGMALPVQAVDAEDIAAAVAWLVSDEAWYITGVTLPVDAGYANKR